MWCCVCRNADQRVKFVWRMPHLDTDKTCRPQNASRYWHSFTTLVWRKLFWQICALSLHAHCLPNLVCEIVVKTTVLFVKFTRFSDYLFPALFVCFVLNLVFITSRFACVSNEFWRWLWCHKLLCCVLSIYHRTCPENVLTMDVVVNRDVCNALWLSTWSGEKL